MGKFRSYTLYYISLHSLFHLLMSSRCLSLSLSLSHSLSLFLELPIQINIVDAETGGHVKHILQLLGKTPPVRHPRKEKCRLQAERRIGEQFSNTSVLISAFKHLPYTIFILLHAPLLFPPCIATHLLISYYLTKRYCVFYSGRHKSYLLISSLFMMRCDHRI